MPKTVTVLNRIDPKERMFVILMTQVMGQDRQRNPIRQKLGSIVHGSIIDRLPFEEVLTTARL